MLVQEKLMRARRLIEQIFTWFAITTKSQAKKRSINLLLSIINLVKS